MKIKNVLFDRDRQNFWTYRKRKKEKSSNEELEESSNNKKSEIKNQVEAQTLDILA